MTDNEPEPVPLIEGVFRIAAEDGRPRLLVSRCRACGAIFFPPRERCNACSEADMTQEEAPPEGELYTWTVIRELGRPVAGFVPYVVGQVDLSEGLRVMGILKCDPEDPVIGMKLRLCLVPQGRDSEGREVVGYGFEPAQEASGWGKQR